MPHYFFLYLGILLLTSLSSLLWFVVTLAVRKTDDAFKIRLECWSHTFKYALINQWGYFNLKIVRHVSYISELMWTVTQIISKL